MNAFDKYRFYIAQSSQALGNPAIDAMTFHFRARNFIDPNNPPSLIFDPAKSAPVRVYQSILNGTTNSTVSVWLEEVNINPSPGNLLIHKDFVFSSPNPPDYDSINGKIIVHVKTAAGSEKTVITKASRIDLAGNLEYLPENIVHDDMDAERPAG